MFQIGKPTVAGQITINSSSRTSPIVAKVDAIEAEIDRVLALGLLQSDDYNPVAEPSSVGMDLFPKLLEAVPTTLAGVAALVTYLDEVTKKDPWKFEDILRPTMETTDPHPH